MRSIADGAAGSAGGAGGMPDVGICSKEARLEAAGAGSLTRRVVSDGFGVSGGTVLFLCEAHRLQSLDIFDKPKPGDLSP